MFTPISGFKLFDCLLQYTHEIQYVLRTIYAYFNNLKVTRIIKIRTTQQLDLANDALKVSEMLCLIHE